MAEIEFTKEEKSILVDKLKIYFEEDLSDALSEIEQPTSFQNR
jgi:uncharacterized protein (DUF2164 family)